jgi:Protein of unknown function (DUF2845)
VRFDATEFGARFIKMKSPKEPRGWLMARPACAAVTVAVLLLATVPVTHASDTMRCGSRIVSNGDGKDKVRALCGEPTSISFVGIQSAPRHYYGPYDYSYFGPGFVEVPVEIWTYNFGSSKLLRKLRFVGDELDEIRTDGYGY